VAVCGWELAHNPAGRAYNLAQMYAAFADTEIIGTYFPKWGRKIWPPLGNVEMPVHSFVAEDQTRFVDQALDLVMAHPYDVVHLSKPRMPNILFGLLYKLIWGTTVLMDIDDEELAFADAETPLALEAHLQKHGRLPELTSLEGKEWTRLGVGLATAFDGITVSNPALQKRYGGQIIRHARDEKRFQPSPELSSQSRKKFKVPPDKKVVLFFGTPREHKGLLETARAIAGLGRRDVVFAIAGDFPDPALKQKLQEIKGVETLFLGNQPVQSIPEVTALGDVCVLLQEPGAMVSNFQIPAKLTDALAMGRTVILQDLPPTADVIQSGAVIPVKDKNALPRALEQALAQPPSAQPDTRARDLFLKKFSFAANTPRLRQTLQTARSAPKPLDTLHPLLQHIAPLVPYSSLAGLPSKPNAPDTKHQKTDNAVSIIILTRNAAQHLDNCLNSFIKTNTHNPVELIIIDHASTDNTADVVAKYRNKGDIQYIHRDRNYTFSESCNFGATRARHPYLLFLNNDIHYTDDVLGKAVETLRKDEKIGAVGVRLDDNDYNKNNMKDIPRSPEYISFLKNSLSKPKHNTHFDIFLISKKVYDAEKICLQKFLSDIFFSKKELTSGNMQMLMDHKLSPAIDCASQYDKVSVISAVYNKVDSLPEFIQAFSDQTYSGVIELILVDDVSDDSSPELINILKNKYEKPNKFIVRLILHKINSGNCIARNTGIQASTGDVLIIMDADCIVNKEFVQERIIAHQNGYDVCIGPMGLESNNEDIIKLHKLYSEDRDKLYSAMRLQYNHVPTAFMNCVTRNFSITRSFFGNMNQPLFDARYSYRKESGKGFGWEDVEMGYRLFSKKAKIWFVEKAISIHKTHPPEIPDSEKPQRSMHNFLMLLSENPLITKVAPDWSRSTFEKIRAWLKRYSYNENNTIKQISQKIDDESKYIPNYPALSPKKLKIATYRWHTGHQYDLWKLPHEFTLFKGISRITMNWDYNSRPLPSNTTFRSIDYCDKDCYNNFDLAILHFDEFILHPELTNGRLSKDWGNQFKHMMENFKGPKVAICHGVPYYKGDFEENYNGNDIGIIQETYRKELVDFLDNILVICNSHEAQKEWGFKNSKVIWQGFDPLMYPLSNHNEKIITVSGDMLARPIYRGYNFYKKVMDNIGWNADYLGDKLKNSVEKPLINQYLYNSPNDKGLAEFQNYAYFLSSYGIFFNPTMRSPMPRTRGEALMTGMALVTTPNHDADKFIEHGYNGFLTTDPVECANILKDLQSHKELRTKIGERGRETALDFFHVNRLIHDWTLVIQEVLDENMANSSNLTQTLKDVARARKKNVTRVLFVCNLSFSAGTTRYRPIASAEALRKYGIIADCILATEAKKYAKDLYAGKYDFIVCHRLPWGSTFETLKNSAERFGIKIIMDFDDLVFHEDYACFFDEIRRKKKIECLEDVRNFQKALENCFGSIASTKTIKRELNKLGIMNTEILPNTVPDETLHMSNSAYKEKKNRVTNREVVIGYSSGSETHEKDFRSILPAIEKILNKFKNSKLNLLGHIEIPSELNSDRFNGQVTKIPFTEAFLLPKTLALLDINIAPLEDRVFCQAKSALKYFEAGLVGVPTIASDTEPFREAIKHGETGFVAKTIDDWYKYLDLLVSDRSKRVQIGEAARNDALENYTSINRAMNLEKILNDWL
jgi:glycosyltransferase involved in cell wall biosynthesis/GT2 family glycosyltransferase